jgi:hypothetical protein
MLRPPLLNEAVKLHSPPSRSLRIVICSISQPFVCCSVASEKLESCEAVKLQKL